MQSRLSWRRLVLFLSLLLATLLYVLLTTDIFESYEASNSTKLPTTNPPPVSTTTEATLATEEAAIPTNTFAPPLHCNGVTQKDYEHMTQLSNKPKCLWPGFSVPMPISQEQRAYVVFTLHPKTNLHLAPVLAALWLEQQYTPIILVQPEKPEDRGTRREMMDLSSVVAVLGGYLFYLPALDSFTSGFTCAGVSLDFLHSVLAIQYLHIDGAENSMDAEFLVPFLPNLGPVEVLSSRDKLPWLYQLRHERGKMNRFEIWTDKNESSRIVGILAPLKEWRKTAADKTSPTILRLPELACRISVLQETLCRQEASNVSIESVLNTHGLNAEIWHALGNATQYAADHQQDSSPSLALEQVIKEPVKTDWMQRVLLTHYKLIDPPRLYFFLITTASHRPLIAAVSDTWLEPDVRVAAGGIENFADIMPAEQELLGLDPKIERGTYNQLVNRVLHILEVIKLKENPNNTYDWIIKVDDDTYVRKAAVLYDLVKLGDTPIGILRGRKYCGTPSLYREICYCRGPIYSISRTAFAQLDIQRCRSEFANYLNTTASHGSWEDFVVSACLSNAGVPYCEERGMKYAEWDGRELPFYYHHKTDAEQMRQLWECDAYGVNG